MPGNALLRRFGIERASVIERAIDAADSGFWLALRVSHDVRDDELSQFFDRWARAELSSITLVVLPAQMARPSVSEDDRCVWLTEMRTLSDESGHPQMIPAAAKGAERLCREARSPLVALDESVPDWFADPCFAARAEREKSFVRCAKALLTSAAEAHIDRVSMWTRTPRVLGACRVAAHALGLNAGRYEFCVSHLDGSTAERLLREGESIRVCYPLDRASIDRAVAR